eukprot:gene8311-135_t
MSELDKAILHLGKPKLFTDIPRFSLDFETVFNDSFSADFKIICDYETYYAHRLILKSRCQFFKDLLNQKPDLDQYELVGDKFHPPAVKEVLRYMYTGHPILNDDNWKKVLPIANEFELSKLSDLCFAQKMKKVNIESVLSLILVARSGTEPYYDDSFVEACIQLLAKKPNEVFDTREFTRLDAQTIIFILKNDNLEIEEIELFNHICRWGRAQCSSGQDLKEILTEDIMQHIRYPLMTSDELYHNVKSTGLIPPKQWVDALEYLVTGDELPPRYAPRGGNSASSGRKAFKAGYIITLMNASTGKYLSANNDRSTFSGVTICGPAEQFTVEEGQSGKFGLKTNLGTYLSANDDKYTISQYDSFLEWEIFDVVATEGGKVAFQTPHASYVTIDNTGLVQQNSSYEKQGQFNVKIIKKQ